MTLFQVFFACTLYLASQTIAGNPEVTLEPGVMLALSFKEVDMNGDGIISPRELGTTFVASVLEAADRNHDGLLDSTEIPEMNKCGAKKEVAIDKDKILKEILDPMSERGTEFRKKFWKVFDKNGDGRVTEEEYDSVLEEQEAILKAQQKAKKQDEQAGISQPESDDKAEEDSSDKDEHNEQTDEDNQTCKNENHSDGDSDTQKDESHDEL